jgi:hypothetical protein
VAYQIHPRLGFYLEYRDGALYSKVADEFVTHLCDQIFVYDLDQTGVNLYQHTDESIAEPTTQYLTSSDITQIRNKLTRQNNTRPHTPLSIVPEISENEADDIPVPPSPPSPALSDDHSEDYLPTPINMTTPSKDALKGNKPTPFTGDRHKLDDFIADCNLYLTITAPKAEGATKKAWFLTFIQGGEASSWKTQYVNSPEYNSDTYDQFRARFIKVFEDPQKKANACTAIDRLWQNNLTVDQYYARFVLLANRASLSDDLEKAHLFIRHLN